MILPLKIFIDRYVGSVMLRLSAFFRRDRKKIATGYIVVCKFYGIGSIVQSTMLLNQIKSLQSDVKIIYLTSAGNLEIAQRIRFIDDILIVDDRNFLLLIKSMIKVIRLLKNKNPEIFYDIETHAYFSTVIALLGRMQTIKCLYSSSTMHKKHYTDSAMLYDGTKKLSNIYASLCNGDNAVNLLYDFNHAGLSEGINISKLNGKKYIVCNINASSLRTERRWPLQNFAMLIEKLSFIDKRLFFVLTGNASERKYVESLITCLPEAFQQSVMNTAGKINLQELMQIIKNSKFVLTNDTGPMHIALALQKPLVALFGPNNPDAYVFNPSDVIVYKKVSCSPCVHLHYKSPCNGDNICMKNITVAEVFEKCILLLNHECALN